MTYTTEVLLSEEVERCWEVLGEMQIWWLNRTSLGLMISKMLLRYNSSDDVEKRLALPQRMVLISMFIPQTF